MAIDKKVENEHGAFFEYHKIKDVRIINDERKGIQIFMTVQSFIDKRARIDGKQPTVRQCIINNADFALTPFYALLKAKFPDFNGNDDMDNSFKCRVNNDPVKLIEQTLDGKLINKVVENEGTGS